MSTKATGNKKHLTLADRAAIEHGISRGENFTQIACRINDESCFETRRKNCEQKQLSRYIRELEKHGYHVKAQS